MTTIDTTLTPATTLSAPVSARDRIETLDILRGFAVLGILAVNAIAFAWPLFLDPAEPSAPFDTGGANQIAVWAVEALLHNKGRALFSMLFGVSIFLVGGERDDLARGRLLRRRLAFLALFGLIHGLALWYGDILLLYAWSGLFVMLARSWPPARLLRVGICILVTLGLLEIGGTAYAVLQPHDPAKAADEIEKARTALTVSIEAVRSGWLGAVVENAKNWALVQSTSLIVFVFPTAALMMIGLGLFKGGYLAGRSSNRLYVLMLATGAAIAVAFGVTHWRVVGPGVPPAGIAIADSALDALAPLGTLAYVALLVLATRHGLGFVTRRLAPVGRMAFTNYLTQSLIMASLFYMPWGPQLYAKVEPAALWGIVAGIWALQLIWSPLWLSRFQMGPLEWVWRCLTYGRRVPLLKSA